MAEFDIHWLHVQFPFSEDPNQGICPECEEGTTKPDTTSSIYPIEVPIVGVDTVPAKVCGNCGTEFVSLAVLHLINQAQLQYFQAVGDVTHGNLVQKRLASNQDEAIRCKYGWETWHYVDQIDW